MLLKEKIVNALLGKAKRHPAFKIPALVMITCVVGLFHFIEALRRNKGRCCMLAAIVLMFMFGSSFSPHAEAIGKEEPLKLQTTAVISAQSSSAIDTITSYKTADISAYEQGMQISDFIEIGETPADTADIDAFIEKTQQEDKTTEVQDTETTETESTETDSEENSNVPADADTLVIYDESGNQVAADFSEDWKLILVNKQNPVPEGYEMNLVSINGSMQVDNRIAKPLAEMLNAAKEDGVSLMICSAYRSYERQITLFENKIKRSMRNGLSYLDAYADASYSVTVPGTSEHQLGLALDIVTPSYTSLNEGFEGTEAGKWLKAHSSEYGFILRYPKGREHITGIIYEPWHFRYVGEQAAKEITENELTLEEYLEQIGMK